ncbi:hypothetical protein [Devosia sp. Leaf64]|uniref:hypothetical protein n=1 Tax=Devosia sp. Leaf64 TaxID=1736229 RepID=UPI0007127751|nr:hypothetical protein [Devosia sp. Leaf64]KQN72396.1 hypothetical protein ASE94_07740 [Devosia sp. Leaf64]
MLGADGIYVELAGEAYELRPSLRACTRLVHRHQWAGLLAGVQGFDITIIADMLRETGIKPVLLVEEIATSGLGAVRNRFTGPLAEFVLAIAGIDPDNTTPIKPSSGTPITPDEYHSQLFQIATGWLGWTPDHAWSATPAEILAAQTGHIAYLQMTGVLVPADGTNKPNTYTPERLKQIEEAGNDPAFDRQGLAALKAKIA